MTLTAEVQFTSALCEHCATPLSANQDRFCCPGCEVAFEIITGQGWEQYYRVRDVADASPVDPEGIAQSFDYLNTEEYRVAHTHTREDGCLEATWYLDGLRCGACGWLVERASGAHGGIREARLDFGEARLDLVFDADADLVSLASVLASLGYVAGLTRTEESSSGGDLLRLGLVGAMAANLMLMSVPFYAGLDDPTMSLVFGWISAILALPLLSYGARDFFSRAKQALVLRLPSLDLPIAIGLSGAYLLSTFSLVRGHYHQMYFDSMGMLVFFLLLGAHARNTGVRRALAAGRKLLARMPQLVEVQRGDGFIPLPAAEVRIGDTLRLRAGDVLPLDGVLLSEGALLNLHVVSGESKPVSIVGDAEVLAGSVNLGGEMLVRATTTFNDSRFARLEEQARGLNRRQASGPANGWAGRFLLFAFGSALLGVALWWQHGAIAAATVALTVLVVVCPCALALAEPVAQAFALREAAQMGAWIKSTAVFDVLPRIVRVVFDKTGVLTRGEPSLVRKEFYGSPHWLEAAVLALEEHSRHPLSLAFQAALQPRPVIASVQDVRVVPGAGITGKVDGRALIVASPMRLHAFGIDPELAEKVAGQARDFGDGYTLVCVLCEGQLAALFGLCDETRSEVPHLIGKLAHRGLKLEVLSGDDHATVSRLADSLGLDAFRGNMLPEDKLREIEAGTPATTLMVGDGFNDMGALAAAGVAVTHAHASEAALRFSDVIFRDRDLRRLDGLFDLAATTRLALRRGVMLSLGYNLVAVVLALMGTIGPLGAALLMPASSLSLMAMIGFTFRQRSSLWVS